MTDPNASWRTVTMRIWFWYWLSPAMMRPVWPPEMPKTYSMPASANTRATRARDGVSSVTIRSTAIALSSGNGGRSLQRPNAEYNARDAAPHAEARFPRQPPSSALRLNKRGTKSAMSRSSMRAKREAERRFPVRIRVAVPPDGFGRQLAVMHAWLDETCGPEGWHTAAAGLSGVVNDAVAFYFADAAFAYAFVNRFCCGFRVE